MIKRSTLNNIILQKSIFCRIYFAVTLYWRKILEILFFYCSLFLLIYLLVYQFIYAYFVSIEFHGLAIDGTFQLFNPLRRMGEGQTPGRDFQFFHGLGIVYLHYLPYILLGKNLFSSEMTRHLVSFYLFIFTNYLFLLSVQVSKELALLFSVTITFAAEFLGLSSLLYPGNSLLGIRSSMPVITASLLIFLLRSEQSQKLASKTYLIEIFIAFLLVLCFFVSTEHGVAAVLGMLLTLVALPFLKRAFIARLKSATVVFVFFVLFTVCLYFLCCGWEFYKPLKYALVDVPQDQFWYFATPTLEFNATIFYRLTFAVLLLLTSIAFYCFTGNRFNQTKFGVIVFLIIYGIASNVGCLVSTFPDYSTPLYRVEILIVIYYCVKGIPSTTSFSTNLTRLSFTILRATLIFALLVLNFTFVNLNKYNLITQLHTLANTPLIAEHQVLGTYLGPIWANSYQTARNIIGTIGNTALVSKPWTDVNWMNGIFRGAAGFFVEDVSTLASIRTGDIATFARSGSRKVTAVNGDRVSVEGGVLDPVSDGYPHPISVKSADRPKIGKVDIWSTYAGLIEAAYQVFHPETDYIIHALGAAARKKYVENFRTVRPEFVMTIRSKFTAYEQWLQNTSWNFYEEIVNNYSPVGFTHYSVIWEKQQDALWHTTETWDGEVKLDAKGSRTVELPLDPQLYPYNYSAVVVNIDYKIVNPWQHLPLIGKLPRYSLQPSNSWSSLPILLPPYRSTFSFPLYVERRTQPVLTLNVGNLLPGVSFKITNLRYRILQVPEVNIRALMDVEAE